MARQITQAAIVRRKKTDTGDYTDNTETEPATQATETQTQETQLGTLRTLKDCDGDSVTL
jgi:hypothetical protein